MRRIGVWVTLALLISYLVFVSTGWWAIRRSRPSDAATPRTPST